MPRSRMSCKPMTLSHTHSLSHLEMSPKSVEQALSMSASRLNDSSREGTHFPPAHEDSGETESLLHPQHNAAAPVAEHLSSSGVESEGHRLRAWVDRWYTPSKVLIIFSLLNFVTYFDRGAIAGSLTAVKVDSVITGGAAAVSDTQSGAVVSGFMVGYMCTCPVFAALGGLLPAKYIILLGMLVWCAACLSTAISSGYWMLFCSRLFVGVGEAAFVGFTVTIIDNIAPPSRRTSWIGIFYSMIPVGTAIGMASGGLVSDRRQLSRFPLSPWRVLFLAEVAAAIPVLFAIAALPPRYAVNAFAPEREDITGDFTVAHTADDGNTVAQEPCREYVPLHTATWEVVTNINYILIVVGFAMYCFVVGAISVWAIPMLAEGPLQLPTAKAAVVMGLSTSLCGIAGSLVGGWAVDLLGGSAGKRGSAKCQLFSAAMMAVCLPCGTAALLQTRLTPFLVTFLLSVLALFSITAPVNAAILNVVRPVLRPYAVSYSVFFIHFLGDFPSPTIAGALSDRFNRGCAALVNPDSCAAAEHTEAGVFRSRLCHWVRGGFTDDGASGGAPSYAGHCVNTYQTRDALLIVFAFLTIAVPCWFAVFVRLRRAAREEERISDVVVVVSAPADMH